MGADETGAEDGVPCPHAVIESAAAANAALQLLRLDMGSPGIVVSDSCLHCDGAGIAKSMADKQARRVGHLDTWDVWPVNACASSYRR